MNETLSSLAVYLQIWGKELVHEIRDLLGRKVILIVSLGFMLFFFMLFFVGFYRILLYIRGTPIVGMALVGRLVGTVFLAMLTMLVYSNVVTAISVLFFSDDNSFLVASPFDISGIMIGKLVKTVYYASWMSLLVIVPLFMAIMAVFRLPAGSYLVMTAGVILYFLIISEISMVFVNAAVRAFPAHKMRDMLILGLVLIGVSLYVVFRLMNIEEILRPGRGALAASYLEIFELPKAAYLPSYWVSSIFVEFINGRNGWLWPLTVLVLMSAGGMLVYVFVSRRMFYPTWEKVQSEEKKRYYSEKFPDNPVLAKDVRAFFRDSRQWTQMILIIALIVIYIFNIYKMPLDIPYLHYLVAFLNIGMIGFVISAVGLRFTFSAISLEGRYIWLLLSSPFDIKKLVRYKYVHNLILIEAIAVLLVIFSNIILRPPGMLNALCVVTVIVSGITVTSIGMGMGALYPKFDMASPAEIETSWGGILYMVYCILYFGITISLEAVWVRMYFFSRMRGIDVHVPAVIVIVFLLVVINIAANLIPMAMGIRNLRNIEFSA